MLAQPVSSLGVLLLIYYFRGSLKEKLDLLGKKPQKNSSFQLLGCTTPAALKLSDKLSIH